MTYQVCRVVEVPVIVNVPKHDCAMVLVCFLIAQRLLLFAAKEEWIDVHVKYIVVEKMDPVKHSFVFVFCIEQKIRGVSSVLCCEALGRIDGEIIFIIFIFYFYFFFKALCGFVLFHKREKKKQTSSFDRVSR